MRKVSPAMQFRSALFAAVAAALFAGCSSGTSVVPHVGGAAPASTVGAPPAMRGPRDTSGGLPFSADLTISTTVVSKARAPQGYSASDAISLAGNIKGVVYWSGQPWSGLTIQLISSTNGTTLTTTSDANGAFSFLAVPSDTYYVDANGYTISGQSIRIIR